MNACNKKEKFIAGVIEQQGKVQNVTYTEEMVYEDLAALQVQAQ